MPTPHKRTGSHLNMVGKPGQRPCRPGNAPCNPLGWQFYDGNTSYFVGQDGWLIVTKGSKTTLRELGAWRER